MPLSREYPPRPIPGVGVVVRKANAVLVIQRGNPPKRGTWGIPGGAVELGETWREAATREVREECGIEIALGEVIDAVDMIFRDDDGRVQYDYALVDFVADYVSGELRAASDVLDARWLTPNGTLIEGVGLTPDIKMDPTTDDAPGKNGPQLYTAIDLLHSEINGTAFVPPSTPAPTPTPVATGAQ